MRVNRLRHERAYWHMMCHALHAQLSQAVVSLVILLDYHYHIGHYRGIEACLTLTCAVFFRIFIWNFTQFTVVVIGFSLW